MCAITSHAAMALHGYTLAVLADRMRALPASEPSESVARQVRHVLARAVFSGGEEDRLARLQTTLAVIESHTGQRRQDVLDTLFAVVLDRTYPGADAQLLREAELAELVRHGPLLADIGDVLAFLPQYDRFPMLLSAYVPTVVRMFAALSAVDVEAFAQLLKTTYPARWDAILTSSLASARELRRVVQELVRTTPWHSLLRVLARLTTDAEMSDRDRQEDVRQFLVSLLVDKALAASSSPAEPLPTHSAVFAAYVAPAVRYASKYAWLSAVTSHSKSRYFF